MCDDDVRLLVTETGLYRPSEVDRILDFPGGSVARWTQSRGASAPIVSRLSRPGRYPSVPFIGLAESSMLRAFKQTGLSMRRIRPAVEVLCKRLQDPHALLSDRLYTDGAEILYEYAQQEDGEAKKLVVVRNNQQVMTEVIESYLKRIEFSDDRLPLQIDLSTRYSSVPVIANPRINSGLPTLRETGHSVESLLSFISAGESYASVAEEFDLDPGMLEHLAMCA